MPATIEFGAVQQQGKAVSITIKWDNAEKTILSYTFDGEWTWQELDIVWRQGENMVEGITQRYDVIMDLRNMNVIPRNALQVMRDRYELHSPNGGLTVLIGANALIRAILDVLTRIKPQAFEHYRCVPTLEEAYQLIANHLRVR
jgi:hypothetical protein